MSETDKPKPDPEQGPQQQSGAEAPPQPEQPPQAEQAPPAQPAPPPPLPPPPAPPVPRRPPRLVKTWIAAAVGAVLLLGGGLGGYFIGAADDRGWDRPTFGRNGDNGPGWGHRRDLPPEFREPPFSR